MRSITRSILLALALAMAFAGTASAQTTGTTLTSGGSSTVYRPGQLQPASQKFLNFFPSPTQIFNIFTVTTTTPTNTMPASYLQQFGYRRATPAQ